MVLRSPTTSRHAAAPMSSQKGKNSGAGKGKKASKPGAEANGDEVLQAVVSAQWRGRMRCNAI